MALNKICRCGNPCSILIIEDDSVIVEVLRMAAHKYEPGCFIIEHVKTVDEALPKFAAIIYDLVIVDLGLSNSQGVPTFLAARDMVAGRAPISVLTASDDEDTEVRCFDAGAVAYVIKPVINAIHFLRRCRGWILKYRRDSELRKLLIRENEILQEVQGLLLKQNLVAAGQATAALTTITEVAEQLYKAAQSLQARYGTRPSAKS